MVSRSARRHPQHLESYAALCLVEVIDDCHSETLGDRRGCPRFVSVSNEDLIDVAG
jgi:hypothetical protein